MKPGGPALWGDPFKRGEVYTQCQNGWTKLYGGTAGRIWSTK